MARARGRVDAMHRHEHVESDSRSEGRARTRSSRGGVTGGCLPESLTTAFRRARHAAQSDVPEQLPVRHAGTSVVWQVLGESNGSGGAPWCRPIVAGDLDRTVGAALEDHDLTGDDHDLLMAEQSRAGIEDPRAAAPRASTVKGQAILPQFVHYDLSADGLRGSHGDVEVPSATCRGTPCTGGDAMNDARLIPPQKSRARGAVPGVSVTRSLASSENAMSTPS